MVTENILPTGWRWVKLGEIAELLGGGTPSREHPEYFQGDIVWLTPTEIPKNRITVISGSKERISNEGLKKSSARLMPKDTVLMTSRASIGYVAIAGTDVTTNQGFASFICNDQINNYYLAYWLLGNVEYFKEQATGTTFKEIIKSKLRNFKLPLPSLPEQERIVAKIEELFTQLDAGTAALKRVQAGLKRYKASVLKAAVEGRLVSHDPSDELAGEMLRRLGKKPLEGEELSVLPEQWCWVRAEQLGDGSRYALKAGPFGSSLKKEFYAANGYKVYGQEQVIRGDPTYGDYYINNERFELLKSNAVKPGDVLISLVGTIGKVLVLPETIEPGIINPRLVKLSLDNKLIYNQFFKLYMETGTARHYFSSVSHGGTMEILNLRILRDLPVPLPPLEEQHRIIEEVEARFSVVIELEGIVDVTVTRSTRLRQSILKQAFEGRL